jgi:sporulation protein YlmC with PRC-barrel domain
MKINTLSLASVVLLATAGLSAAADPPRAAPPAPPAGAPPAAVGTATFRAKQVLGTKIMIQNNTAVGTVDDLVFDNAGNLDYLVVSTGDNKFITVPWDAAKWDLDKKVGTLAITPDVYKTIPTYTATTYPQFYTPTYRTEIYRTYGLTPRELRRLERRIP